MPNDIPRELYARNYDYLVELTAHPSLFPQDSENIREQLARYLSQFQGSTDAEFQAWATDVCVPAVDRLTFIYDLRAECQSAVRAAIYKTLSGYDLDDMPELRRELENEVWIKVILRLDEFRIPGSAKMTTRLYGFARNEARTWAKLHSNRYRIVSENEISIRDAGTEFVSVEELASQRADEMEQAGI